MDTVRNLYVTNSRVKSKYVLDMSEITPRILAMSFPGEGVVHSFTHNKKEYVVNYLNDKYGANYLVLNLSGIPYDTSSFFGEVRMRTWTDHHAPPIKELLQVCYEMYEFLQKKKENVVVLHCLAGKGRTGTTIAAFFLYMGLIPDPQRAIDYFSIKRFGALNKGVEQPSQVRYVFYSDQLINKGHNLDQNGLLKIVRCELCQTETNLIFGEVNEKSIESTCKICSDYDKTEKIFDNFSAIKTPFYIYGDVCIEFYKKKSYLFFSKDKSYCRLLLNTNFIDLGQEGQKEFKYRVTDLDPRQLKKDDNNKNILVKVTIQKYFPDINFPDSNNPMNKIQGIINEEADFNEGLKKWRSCLPTIKPYVNNICFGEGVKSDIDVTLGAFMTGGLMQK